MYRTCEFSCVPSMGILSTLFCSLTQDPIMQLGWKTGAIIPELKACFVLAHYVWYNLIMYAD